MNQTKLAQKKKELRLLVRFYENRIHWLCHGSRKYFGLIQGSRIAIVVETSDLLFNLESGIVMTEYCVALNKLVEDQLEKKDLVYCIQYGSSPNMTNQQGYPFFKFEKQYVFNITSQFFAVKPQSMLLPMTSCVLGITLSVNVLVVCVCYCISLQLCKACEGVDKWSTKKWYQQPLLCTQNVYDY